ncbi:hypothetical protein FA15DRAFT_664517 [Coprinopsis marcescibilis]|uniref:Glycoside hydrolase n=1 Tax=Coprinopsis marcescibilis TaxID=230819 RepID=A0A5C3L9L9_COPMA|nr:hypothetical protein FA15DRAFT_664517 [Coprinopsis marcescibilis]
MFDQGFLLSMLLLSGWALHRVNAQTWCNKNYMTGEPVVPPGGRFKLPAPSSEPLLSLRCAQAIRPYLPGDVGSTDNAILIDTPITFSHIYNAQPIYLPDTYDSARPSNAEVNVLIDGRHLTSGYVPLNSSRYAVQFPLSTIKPRSSAYTLTCRASFRGQTYEATGSLSYLPDPPLEIGTVTKTDLRTGALLARPANGVGETFQPIFPIGFYTHFDDYLAVNLSVISKLKAQGFNTIHPVPPFANLTALDQVLDVMQREGMYLMYDMRWTYTNTTAMAEEVNLIKRRPNLLLWYTADEPDGTSDPLNATVLAYNHITSLDGSNGLGNPGYHPVSLVLNCQDYEWSAYSEGADIVMQDTYMIGNNATHSIVWDTPCTSDFGVCGCDNCKGSFEDISTRMDEFKQRLFINGWDRTKSIWTVPQAFGNSLHWARYPTGREFLVSTILGINHGALGVMAWDDPTTPDIKAAAVSLALSLPKLTPFILNSNASTRQMTVNRIDVGLWTVGNATLILATNMNYHDSVIDVEADLGLDNVVKTTQFFNSGAKQSGDLHILVFESLGSGAFVVERNPQNSGPKTDARYLEHVATLAMLFFCWMISM